MAIRNDSGDASNINTSVTTTRNNLTPNSIESNVNTNNVDSNDVPDGVGNNVVVSITGNDEDGNATETVSPDDQNGDEVVSQDNSQPNVGDLDDIGIGIATDAFMQVSMSTQPTVQHQSHELL